MEEIPPPDGQQAPPPPADGQGNPYDQGAPQDQGSDDQGASFQTFYDQLGSQGTWVQTDNYGYAFQPNVTDPNWAPYSDGHWAYTDEGWTWVSNEPWGWATYHYGRWANIVGTGWVWIPGYRWAPAWVSWRYGGGYCGWAPLPPGTFVGAEYVGGGPVGVGFHFGGDVDISFGIGAGCYNFVRVGDLGYPGYRGRYIDRSRNYTIINNTTNITNINVTNVTRGGGGFRGVNVGGPSLAEVNAHSHEHINTLRLAEANQPGRANLQGNSLAVYAPRMNPASVHQARPTVVGQTISQPTFNRGESINRPLAVNSHLAPATASPEAIQEAQVAQQHAPAHARIATENTPVRSQMDRPLTSLAPVAHETTHTAPMTSNAFHPANTANPQLEHSTANSAFTGEPANHPAAQSNEIKPAQTFHPQTQNETFHPQTQSAPNQTFHPTVSPGEEHHHDNEVQPAQTFHPQVPETHTEVFHPQAVPSQNEAFHPANTQPAEIHHPEALPPSFHPQGGGGGGAPQEHAQQIQHAAQAQHPQAAQHAQAPAAKGDEKKQ